MINIINIKTFIFILLASLAAFANPILSHKYTADPQPIIWNDRLYIYASNDDLSVVESDGYVIQAYTLVSTDDMVNWTDHGEVFRVPRDWNRGNAQNARAYAPGAAVKGNTVYLYPCGAGGPVGVVTAPRPEGPFNDVHNGRQIAPWDNCTNCSVIWNFDPAVFVDDDGQAYLYYGGGPSMCGNEPNQYPCTPPAGQNMRAVRLGENMISVSGNSATTINAPRSFEAAYMHKRGDIYYFSYVNNWDGGDGHPSAAIMYMMGNSPLGPFDLRGPLPVLRNPTLNGENINRHNNNHHGIIEYKGKWYMIYHDRRVGNSKGGEAAGISVNQRNISVDSLVYNADGTMREVVVTENGVRQIKNFDPYQTVSAATINRQSGITTDSVANAGMILTSISNNDWIRLKGVDFKSGASTVTVRTASNTSGGSIEFRTGSNTGTIISECEISGTGGWGTWREFKCEVNKTASAGVKDFLYLVFKGSGEPFRLNWYRFEEDPVVCDGPEPNENPDNQVADGIFAESIGSYWTLKNTGDDVVASASAVCNKANISITSVGAEAYQPQLVQTGITLEQNRVYTLTFKASAAENRTIDVQLERQADEDNGWDWGYTYGDKKTFDLTAEEQLFELTIDMNDPTDNNVQLAFNIGGSGSTHDVTISDVLLLQTGVTSIAQSRNALVAARPSVSVRGKTLNVSSPNNTELRIRVIDVRGKVRANFTASGSERFSMMRIPAGRYFVEVRGTGVRQTVPVVLK